MIGRKMIDNMIIASKLSQKSENKSQKLRIEKRKVERKIEGRKREVRCSNDGHFLSLPPDSTIAGKFRKSLTILI